MAKAANRPRRSSVGSRRVHGKYHFLDVGAEKYGDCILVEFGRVRILIDGSHEKDFVGQPGYQSTPEQLASLFPNEQPPFNITLMVVTHCHKDHVGALPRLVSEGVIAPKWALLTDPRLGFGRTSDDSDSIDLADSRTQRLAAALREEDASDLTDGALAEFMADAATVESKYATMIDDLTDRGIEIVRYRGEKLPAALLTAVKASGMQLLGPSQDQLVLAAAQIAKTNKDATDAVHAALTQDSGLTDVELYRALVNVGSSDAGGGGRGDGMNCQSITLAFGPKNARALLAGDMQFSEPGVRGAEGEVAALRQAVAAAGPYTLFKTTHHTSHNGTDEDLLNELGDPSIIVHSGGLHDPSHPFPDTLQLLKHRASSIVFARTDRNGLITVEPHRGPEKGVFVSRGRVNNFTDNVSDVGEQLIPASGQVAITPSEGGSAQVVIVNLPPGPIEMQVAGVNIVVRASGSQVSRTINTQARLANDPKGASRAEIKATKSPQLESVQLANGRSLPNLLFVTNPERLAANIGNLEAQVAFSAVRAAGQDLLEVEGDSSEVIRLVRDRLRSDNKQFAGLVILGGYDVVPSAVVDVLPSDLRTQLGSDETERDADDFYVWSDEPFGDLDADGVAERPVSRIPDARDAGLFLTALQASSVAPEDRFGVRNIARPFANAIWVDVPGARELNTSRAYLSSHACEPDTQASCQYFMLHGSNDDASVFHGEDDGAYTRAFTTQNVPARFSGLVFSGCCWGALSVSQRAAEIGRRTPAPRLPERSIALSFLKAGANAFVGCTGAHYSGPDSSPSVNYALPLHSAFWRTLPQVDYSASLALFGARRKYGELLGGGRREPLDIARRLKNRAQFTCLGLGW